MKVLAFTKYTKDGPSSRYRHFNYKSCLSKHNIDIRYMPFFSRNYLINRSLHFRIIEVVKAYVLRFFSLLKLFINKDKIDLIILEYEFFPYFPSIFEKLITTLKIPFIVDYDDAIFHKYDQNKNGIIKYLLKNKIPKVIKAAKCVVVGNDYLAEFAKKYNNKVQILPTVVLIDKYIETLNHFKPNPKKKFTICWIGSQSTSHYVMKILPAIMEFVEQTNSNVHLIGFDDRLIDSSLLKKYNIQIIKWTEETEINEILRCDVGIMPLNQDLWSNGKCGFKLIQYMSCKLPVIASPVGVNITIVDNGVNGFLADSNSQWLQSLITLYNDMDLRQAMSINNWSKIKSEFNHNKICIEYSQLINTMGSENYS